MIERFGGGLDLNVHFHTLVLDGVFTEGEGGALLAPYGAYTADYGAHFARPSADHWFGTDELGHHFAGPGIDCQPTPGSGAGASLVARASARWT